MPLRASATDLLPIEYIGTGASLPWNLSTVPTFTPAMTGDVGERRQGLLLPREGNYRLGGVHYSLYSIG